MEVYERHGASRVYRLGRRNWHTPLCNPECRLRATALLYTVERAAASTLTTEKLSHYRVLEKIGAGGMGEVYRAHDEQLDRDVAIKLLPSDSFSDATARARLLREARSAAALNHPHICTVYEVSEADGHAYIAMELIDGKSLSDLVGGDSLPAEEVVRYGIQLAEALAHAHDRGVIH